MNEVNNFAWPVTTVGKYDYNALCKCIEENKEKLKRGKIVILVQVFEALHFLFGCLRRDIKILYLQIIMMLKLVAI